ncbi:MAG: transglutaminase-like domain-containing protein [Bacteroidetes bacterium]|nr:transglutaminase-like domain-containing protein [Bacteroidota bacterium]
MPDKSQNTTLSALITMLDDPDDRVYAAICDKLLSIGRDAIQPLETALDNCLEEQLETRIRAILEKLYQSVLFARFSDWLHTTPDDLFNGFFLVSLTKHRKIDEFMFSAIILGIKTEIWFDLHDDYTPRENIKVINEILFKVYHFEGNKFDIAAPENFYMNTFLSSKKGSPLTLGILYLIICQRLGFPVYGVNLPQHFILAYLKDKDIENPDERDVLFYINPFNNGSVFSRQEIDQFIGQMKIKPQKSFFQPCSNADVIRRLINNLIFSYKNRGMDDDIIELENLLTAFK